MQVFLFSAILNLAKRQGESGGCGALGCFAVILLFGVVVFLIMRGRQDKPELLGASKRPLDSGPLQPHTFACPFPKCGNCGAASDKVKQQWDGLRKVTWTCGYCGNVQVQELKDEELPPSARQRLGLDPGPGMVPGQQGYYPQGNGGGGMGGLLTGMMLGSMLGGGHEHNHHDDDGWGGGSGGDGGDWGDSGGSGDSGSGGDWGDSGGSDWGGGDSGGDSGSDW